MPKEPLPPYSVIGKMIQDKRGWLPVRETPSAYERKLHLAEYQLLVFLEKNEEKNIASTCAGYRGIVTAAGFDKAPLAFQLDALNRFAVSLSLFYSLANDQNLIREAIDMAGKAIALAPPGWEDTCNYVYNLSGFYRSIYDQTGDPTMLEAANGYLRKAIDIAPPDHRNTGLFRYFYLTILQALHTQTGILNYLDDAIQMGEESLLLPLNNRFRAMTLNQLGTVYRRRFLRSKKVGDLDRSIELTRASVGLRDATTDDEDFAGRISNLGNSLLERSKFKGFEACLDEAITLQQQAIDITPKHNPTLTIRYNNLGNGYEEKYDNTGRLLFINKAIHSYKKAIELSAENDPVLPTRYYNLANAYRSKYLHGATEPDLLEAVRLYEQACTHGLQSYPEWALFSALAWGKLMFSRNDFAGAITAYHFGLEAINLLYYNQYNDTDKNTWLKDAIRLSSRLAYAQVRCGMAMDAIISLEQGLARSLREKLEQRQDRLASLKTANKGLYDAFNAALTAYNEGVRSGGKGVALMPLRERLEKCTADIRRLAGFESFLLIPSRRSIEQALAGLTKYTILYFLYQDGELILIIASPNTDAFAVQAIRPDIDPEKLKALITDYLVLLKDSGSDAFKNILDALMTFLGEVLEEPLRSLPLQEDIVLVFTDMLDLLPFAAVFSVEKKVTSAPSMLSFIEVLQTLGRDVDSGSEIASGVGEGPAKMLAITDSDPLEAPLPFSAIEVEGLKAIFGPENLSVYTGENATRQNIFERAEAASHLHIACHGHFDWKVPLNSGIKLYGDTLTLRELLNKEVELTGVRLVNLSSCESGISDFVELPDEAISLPAGFLLAGVPGIVSSLWSVSDISTAVLMNKFYELYMLKNKNLNNNAKDDDPVSALRQAQYFISHATTTELRLAETCKTLFETTGNRVFAQFYAFAHSNPGAIPFSHPYYWAGFYYLGR
jgi:CHAT domain-containing protein